MSRLREIQKTAQEIATAITAILEIEVEIVDKTLAIIAGTGRYQEKIGEKEEEGNLNSEYTYGQVLRLGKTYVIEDATNNPNYAARENELAEICCPIYLHQEVIGLIGLVAFTREQKERLINDQKNLLAFLRQMAFLLASKVSESKITNELRTIIDTIQEGIIAADKNAMVTSCNEPAAQLLGKNKDEIMGQSLSHILSNSPVREVLLSGKKFRDHEELYLLPTGETRHFFTNILPVFNKTTQEISGAVISLRDIADIKSLVYNMTEPQEMTSFQEVLGNSPAIQGVKKLAGKVAESQSTVLITGESGTGKGLFARSIHYASHRQDKPFVTVNCGAIPDTLLESELFGYEPGAFTGASRTGKVGKFELANGGTIFLDEIGDLSFHLQVKLLHVLQHRVIERIGGKRPIPLNIRVIAATNSNLEQMIKDGEFREDLYFRLNVIPLHLLPLRERKEDIPLLLQHALKKYSQLMKKNIVSFESKAMESLVNYQWPGNIRELENAVEYSVNMENSTSISMASLPQRLQQMPNNAFSPSSLKSRLEVLEKEIIEDHLAKLGHSLEAKRKIAQLLEISESTLYRRLKKLQIED